MAYAQDADLRAPSDAIAGNPASIGTSGGGAATFYLVGPSIAVKRDVKLGEDIALSAKELQSAGKYVAIVCSGSCHSVGFFVAPAKPVNLTFLVHPSRAPVGQPNMVSGVALPFDEFHNLVLTPALVEFQITAAGVAPTSHRVSTQNGVAWFHTNSGRSAGALQITASINDVSARRVVQQVASDPCSLRIRGQRNDKGFVVETEPVRDCTGNPVPDGTIVTFTAKDAQGMDTVDAPIKKGIARAQLKGSGTVTISAASGVVMGNELRLGAQ
ncbi:MAG TPA: hypothetical protein VGK96_10390 [Candidatus Sulfotelmatobacter sp.]|jgi:hypothetical protein